MLNTSLHNIFKWSCEKRGRRRGHNQRVHSHLHMNIVHIILAEREREMEENIFAYQLIQSVVQITFENGPKSSNRKLLEPHSRKTA